MEIKTVGVACDHAGYPLKQFVIQYLEEHKYAYKDFGCNSDLSCDYPDYAHPLAEAIESGEVYPVLLSVVAVRVWQLHLTSTKVYAQVWYGTRTLQS